RGRAPLPPPPTPPPPPPGIRPPPRAGPGPPPRALGIYASLGFTEYGRLPDFVAVGERRYDKVFCMLDFRRAPQGAQGSQGS
ncbi:hypothetical protein ACFXA9_22865, partial [Streptomyces sp. NPDC059411]